MGEYHNFIQKYFLQSSTLENDSVRRKMYVFSSIPRWY